MHHYGEIDDHYTSRFGVKRKKSFDIEEMFELSHQEVEEEQTKKSAADGPAVKWDTLVCAAKEDGFQRAFIEQKAWWAVRLNAKTYDKIKYIAMYQVAPVSKVTYYGEVDHIEP